MMRKNETGKNIIFTIIGFLICASGLYMVKSIPNKEGIMLTLPYLCVGIGTGIFGQNFGTVISALALRNDPASAKRIEIETKDERNTAIRNKAKAKAYDLMVMVFGALMLSFGLMNADMTIILSFVAAYLFIVFSSVYYFSKYQKEM